MTTERAQAYARVTKTLADMGPSKLQRGEQAVVREAADALLFAEGAGRDAGAVEAVAALYELAARLVESERWLAETAAQLVRDVEGCGPVVGELPVAELATA